MPHIRLLSLLAMLFIAQTACVEINDGLVDDLTTPHTSEIENESELEFDLTIELDLVEHVSGGRHVRPGEQLRLDTYLTNFGPDPSPGRTPTSTAYLVGWYLSSDTDITADDIRIGSFSGNSLDAGETWRFWGDVTVPIDIEGGWYYWGAIIDYTELQDETDESNNSALGIRVVVR